MRRGAGEGGATGDEEGQWRSLQKHIHEVQFKEATLKGAAVNTAATSKEVMKVQRGRRLPHNNRTGNFLRSSKSRENTAGA